MQRRQETIDWVVRDVGVSCRVLLAFTDDGANDVLNVDQWDAVRALAAATEPDETEQRGEYAWQMNNGSGE